MPKAPPKAPSKKSLYEDEKKWGRVNIINPYRSFFEIIIENPTPEKITWEDFRKLIQILKILELKKGPQLQRGYNAVFISIWDKVVTLFNKSLNQGIILYRCHGKEDYGEVLRIRNIAPNSLVISKQRGYFYTQPCTNLLLPYGINGVKLIDDIERKFQFYSQNDRPEFTFLKLKTPGKAELLEAAGKEFRDVILKLQESYYSHPELVGHDTKLYTKGIPMQLEPERFFQTLQFIPSICEFDSASLETPTDKALFLLRYCRMRAQLLDGVPLRELLGLGLFTDMETVIRITQISNPDEYDGLSSTTGWIFTSKRLMTELLHKDKLLHQKYMEIYSKGAQRQTPYEKSFLWGFDNLTFLLENPEYPRYEKYDEQMSIVIDSVTREHMGFFPEVFVRGLSLDEFKEKLKFILLVIEGDRIPVFTSLETISLNAVLFPGIVNSIYASCRGSECPVTEDQQAAIIEEIAASPYASSQSPLGGSTRYKKYTKKQRNTKKRRNTKSKNYRKRGNKKTRRS
jgi:hypothetical protein